LLDLGLTKSWIAKKLGYSTRALQLNMFFITAENAAKIRSLYNEVMLAKERVLKMNKDHNDIICDACGLVMGSDGSNYSCLCGNRVPSKRMRDKAA
jgi:tRNA(Ile2) C34 agmatinyltransferase TiaS